MSIEVFMSYAHADRELRDELAKHLSGLTNQGIIKSWFDGDIIEGTAWRVQIIEHLHTAQIILLLVSADFITSNFCYAIEMTQALARHEKNLARVIPIILRPTDWTAAPFAKLRALPTDGKAVTLWRNRDEAFLDIVRGIKKAIRDLQDGTSSLQDGASTVAQQPLDDQNASPSPPLPTPSSSVHNQIGSITATDLSIVQARTQYTNNNYYDAPKRKSRTSSSKRRIGGKKKM